LTLPGIPALDLLRFMYTQCQVAVSQTDSSPPVVRDAGHISLGMRLCEPSARSRVLW
jgi:hypothetical protein